MNTEKTKLQVYFNEACNNAGSDKNCLNHTFAGYSYMDHYADLCPERWQTEPIRILEFGVLNGSSLRMWRQIFPRALIVGVDSSFVDPAQFDENTRIIRASQSDRASLKRLSDQYGPFDLVVDDASHAYSDMLSAATLLLPRMRAGGLYVIEDITVGWPLPSWPGMADTTYGPNDFYELFRFLGTVMNQIMLRTGPTLSLHFFHGMVAFRIADTTWTPVTG